MIQYKDFSQEQKYMEELMSEISESAWFAGWMGGLERILWDALEADILPDSMCGIDPVDMEKLKAMRTELDGWVIFLDGDYIPGIKDEDCGPVFLTFEEWSKLRAEYNLRINHDRP